MKAARTRPAPPPHSIALRLNPSLAALDQRQLLADLLEILCTSVGVKEAARNASLNRTSIYRSLKPDANPCFVTVMRLLDSLGLQLAVVPKQLSDEA